MPVAVRLQSPYAVLSYDGKAYVQDGTHVLFTCAVCAMLHSQTRLTAPCERMTQTWCSGVLTRWTETICFIILRCMPKACWFAGAAKCIHVPQTSRILDPSIFQLWTKPVTLTCDSFLWQRLRTACAAPAKLEQTETDWRNQLQRFFTGPQLTMSRSQVK